MTRFRVSITGQDYNAMADLVREFKVSVTPSTVRRTKTRKYLVDGFATNAQIRALKRAGYKIKVFEDVDKLGKKRQAELRKAAKQRLVMRRRTRGTHRPMVRDITNYLTVEEVEESILNSVAAPHDSFTELITLPHKTWEDRSCHAVKIAYGNNRDRVGIYLLGGIHAREWGSPDILINFIQELTAGYQANSGITVGSKSFKAAEIQHVVNHKDVFVFPQANPDGRHYSMTKDPQWRKNRRPPPVGSHNGSCVGVDINRNYDFMWNYTNYFDPAAPIVNSTSPCDYEVYIGPTSTSEPETKNVVWMQDTYSNIRYFIDLHSYSEAILYNWGDDVNQMNDSSMNFQNPAYDGRRGIIEDPTYREYIDRSDRTKVVSLASRMRNAIKSVRGRNYEVMQSVGLYPTAGSSDDYAFSRHLVDSNRSKIYSYTIEWGSKLNKDPFHPPYKEMKQIILENTAGLLEFCIRAE